MSNLVEAEQEYELTYLASRLPEEVSGVEPVEMVDVYAPRNLEVHSRLRIRKKGNSCEITKKTPVSEGDASAHDEKTIEISEEEFDDIIKGNQKRVEKSRYKVNIEGRPAEVDVFKGALDGLVVIDFEFETEEEKDKFDMPSVCLADITQEDFIAGGLLAGKSYSDIEPELERFDYKKING